MTEIITGAKTEFLIDPAILELLPPQGCVELQHDAAGKVHHFHTHPVDEILLILKGALKFWWEGEMRVVRPGDTIILPAGTLHQIGGRGQLLSASAHVDEVFRRRRDASGVVPRIR